MPAKRCQSGEHCVVGSGPGICFNERESTNTATYDDAFGLLKCEDLV